MDARLVPINAFIALASAGGTSYPNALYEIGFRLEGLEIPIDAGGGRIVIDCVAFDATSNTFIAAESKSGNNIEAEQAIRYGRIRPDELVRLIGVTIREAGDQVVQALYLCVEESADRIMIGLGEASCEYPLLAVGSGAISLHNADYAPEWLAAAFASPVDVPGPPPAIIKVDDQSPDEDFDPIVAAALVAAVSQGRDVISCPELSGRAIPYLSLFGKGHQNTLTKAVTQAAKRACEAAPDNFEFRPATQQRDHTLVKILDSPEDADPRGRTQRYQSLRTRLGGAGPSDSGEEQGSLFDEVDLAAELEKADTGMSDDSDLDEEENR